MKILLRFVLCLLFLIIENPVFAKKEYALSFLNKSLAPNAGGQQSFSVNYQYKNREYSVFASESLFAGELPLAGFVYSLRFDICENYCFLQSSLLPGFGVGTSGPVGALTWSFEFLWILRVDVTSHFYFLKKHIALWNYPLWIGLSFPL